MLVYVNKKAGHSFPQNEQTRGPPPAGHGGIQPAAQDMRWETVDDDKERDPGGHELCASRHALRHRRVVRAHETLYACCCGAGVSAVPTDLDGGAIRCGCGCGCGRSGLDFVSIPPLPLLGREQRRAGIVAAPPCPRRERHDSYTVMRMSCIAALDCARCAAVQTQTQTQSNPVRVRVRVRVQQQKKREKRSW